MPSSLGVKGSAISSTQSFLRKLFKNEPVCIGLDVGSHSIKGVKIRKGSGNTFSLVRYGVEPIGTQKDPVQREKATGRVLQALGAEKAPVIAAVGGTGTVLRSVVVPKMTPEELKTALTFEAEKYIPFKLDEVFIDSAILADQPGGRMEISLAAARQDLVRGLVEMLASAGAAPAVVDLEAVALANAWEASPVAAAAEPVGLIHVGARGTLLNFLKGTQFQFTREIPLGGELFTKVISEGLKVDFAQAETIKCQPGERRAEVRALLQPHWDQWVGQCRASLDFYENQFGQRVGRLFLSGGSSRLDGFREWVQEMTGFPTEMWNPFAKLQTSLNAEEAQQLGGILAVAVGLGVRGAGK